MTLTRAPALDPVEEGAAASNTNDSMAPSRRLDIQLETAYHRHYTMDRVDRMAAR